MPIKIPKGFTRRKSSGNALDEVVNPPEPSFRVFERPRSGSKSFDGGNVLRQMGPGRPSSTSHHLEDNLYADTLPSLNPNNRGSGGTNNSSSSGGHYDTSSSSARFSSSSTLPSSSSLDAIPDDRSHSSSKQLPIPPISETRPTFPLRVKDRAFSIGRKPIQSLPISEPNYRPNTSHAEIPVAGNVTRERALTESSYASQSTATPPKILDSDLDFGSPDDPDGFGNIFESFGRRRSRVLEDQSLAMASPDTMPPAVSAQIASDYFHDRNPYTPQPHLSPGRSLEMIPSPRSLDSRDSNDGLMVASSLQDDQRRYELMDRPVVPPHQLRLVVSKTMPFPSTSESPGRPRAQRPGSGAGAGIRRSSAYSSQRASTPLQDEDAQLVMDSVGASRKLNQLSGAFDSSPREGLRQVGKAPENNQTPGNRYSATSGSDGPPNSRLQNARRSAVGLFDDQELNSFDNDAWSEESGRTPRALKTDASKQRESLLFNSAIRLPHNTIAQRTEKSPMRLSNQPKIMTPAQFEQYRNEQETSRIDGQMSKADASDDESDNYDDDDEAEQNRQVAKQRRKQEAHLAVYRQQMMKVTGEQPSNMPSLGQPRPSVERASLSTPNLGAQLSTANLSSDKPGGSGKSSDDEDEDVPLGILAAHGFPAKNRAPGDLNRMSSNSNIRYTSETYPPPASTSGETTNGGRGGLPPFAKNLPQDPYFGAGLVNPSNREPLAFSNAGRASIQGGPPPGVLNVPGVPTGGLVGVIAGEERARAMRRGSPNAQGNYGPANPSFDMPTHAQGIGGMPQMHSGMGPMGMPQGMPPAPLLTPGDQAQIQMSQSMTQMMQMQMQWMQQMMVMQNGQTPPSQPPMPMPPMPALPQFSPQVTPNNGLLTPQSAQLQRPFSMGSHSAPTTPAVQQGQQRAMSMLDPTVGAHWAQRGIRNSNMSGALGPPPGYTPSIAPSERSNVGMPSRYRPVSTIIDEAPKKASRASTFTSSSGLQGWTERKSGLQNSIKLVDDNKKTTKGGSDDDDDEGWEEMKKKREKSKSSWRLKKKDDHGLGDVFYPGT